MATSLTPTCSPLPALVFSLFHLLLAALLAAPEGKLLQPLELTTPLSCIATNFPHAPFHTFGSLSQKVVQSVALLLFASVASALVLLLSFLFRLALPTSNLRMDAPFHATSGSAQPLLLQCRSSRFTSCGAALQSRLTTLALLFL
ncbi:hypothetical protein GOP47_0020213 [Adiantum capillus-veneris]|uniref:Uncharacterized protein n=1 Tax=Adiantum capillus-veneris TaxID=13818 RepID=A0A9D4UCJ5_ADICA|nr:hypothetical protein GOP47_0020213 [Adiantum capillus-veneris]